MVIAIDGPSGAGKSSVARAVAERLGFTYLDTGAMYRAVALAALEQAVKPTEAVNDVTITLDGRVFTGRDDVTTKIRTPAVSEAASQISTDPQLREAMVQRQQEILGSGNWVAEGRDIGTVVAPHAELKLFLTASAQERAQRRALELGADFKTVLAEQLLRDQRDTQREHSPLKAAADAVEIDTTEMSLEAVVDRIVQLADQVRAHAHGSNVRTSERDESTTTRGEGCIPHGRGSNSA